MFLKSVAKKL